MANLHFTPLPFPPASYDQRFFNETVKTLNLHFRSIQSAPPGYFIQVDGVTQAPRTFLNFPTTAFSVTDDGTALTFGVVGGGGGTSNHSLLTNRSDANSHPATAISNTAAGNISSTTVQAAINELDTEKVAKAGDTMTGNLGVDTEVRIGDTGAQPYAGLLSLSGTGNVRSQVYSYGDAAANVPSIILGKARGTYSSPTEVKSGDRIGAFLGVAHNGTSWQAPVGFNVYAAQDLSAGNGTRFAIATTPLGSTTRADVFHINASGEIGLGSGNAVGSSGQLLTSSGSGALPTWTTPSWLPLTGGTMTGPLVIGDTTPGTLATGLNVAFVGASTVIVEGQSGTAVNISRFSADITSPNVNFKKSRGTIASPTATQNTDELGTVNWLCVPADNAGTRTMARLTALATTIPATSASVGVSNIILQTEGPGARNNTLTVGQAAIVSLAPVHVPNGAVGTPSYSFGSDTTTGFYRIGASSFGASVGGTQAFRVESTGAFLTNAPSNYWVAGQSVYTLRASGASYGQLDSQGGYEVTLTSNGFRAGSSLWESYAAGGNTGAAQVALHPSGYVEIRAESSKATGAAQAVTAITKFQNGQALTQRGTAATPGWSFIADTDTGIYSDTANYLQFTTAGVERLRFHSSGAWGLAGANYGTSGQVLTSNGSASAPTWQTPSGGGGGGTAGTATVTIPGPAGLFEHEETVAAVGTTSASTIIPSLAHHSDDDENHEQLLDLVTLTAEPGTDAITFRMAFSQRTSGIIRVNYVRL